MKFTVEVDPIGKTARIRREDNTTIKVEHFGDGTWLADNQNAYCETFGQAVGSALEVEIDKLEAGT